MPAVLVTGGTGFIGLHLVEALLARGHTVRCLVRPSSQVAALKALGVELVAAPLTDPAALRAAIAGTSTVFHVAGLIRAFRQEDFYLVNEQGTAHIAAACAAEPAPPTLIFVSSIAAAGPCQRGQIRIESDPPAPLSNYGRSKLAAERAAAIFADRLPLTIVRPGIVFGPRDAGFNQVLRAIRRTYCHLSPGFFPPPLSFLHVADLVQLLLTAAERGQRVPPAGCGKPGQGYYFAAAPEHPTYADIGRLLRPMLNRPRAPIIPVAGPIAYCVGGLSECVGRLRGRAEELCRDKIRDALAPSWACSGESARRDFGFAPAKPLVSRLQETVDWCYANRWI